MDNLEFKNLSGGVKDIDTAKRVVVGYLSAFGNIDHDGDIMLKSAVQKTVSERKNDIFFLNQHDWKQPLSKFNILEADDYGLKFESMPLPDTSYGNDVIKLYEAGVLKEHSIGFSTVKSDYDTKSNIRTIKEIKLFEGSVVTLAANSMATFDSLKSLCLKDINDQASKIMKALRNGTFTDETFGLLEIALKQLQLQSYELGKKSLGINEPLNDTQIKDEPMQIEIIKSFTHSLKTN